VINTTSPAAGTLAPELPPDVAAQVDVEFQFPIATEYRLAGFAVTLIIKIQPVMLKSKDKFFITASL
jgi:hypothetical protein